METGDRTGDRTGADSPPSPEDSEYSPLLLSPEGLLLLSPAYSEELGDPSPLSLEGLLDVGEETGVADGDGAGAVSLLLLSLLDDDDSSPLLEPEVELLLLVEDSSSSLLSLPKRASRIESSWTTSAVGDALEREVELLEALSTAAILCLLELRDVLYNGKDTRTRAPNARHATPAHRIREARRLRRS